MVILVLIAVSTHAGEPAKIAEMSADFAVEVVGPVVADLPIQLKLTITNTGQAPPTYWCGGPGRYPTADPFFAEVTDATGRTFGPLLHNGQYWIGSGNYLSIDKVETLPAACDPLGPGSYTLRVVGRPRIAPRDGRLVPEWPAMRARPITLKVEENRAARAAAEKEVRARAAKDPFAKYIAKVYSINPIVKGWLDQFVADDFATAFKACGEMQFVRRLPPGGDALLKQAAVKRCRREPGGNEWQLLQYTATVGANVRTEEGLDAVLMVAKSRPDWVGTYAVGRLSCFPQQRAEDALVAYAKGKDAAMSWCAVRGLAERHNRFAIAPLIKAAMKQSRETAVWNRRWEALRWLSNFADDPEVAKVLRDAANDPTDMRPYAELIPKGAAWDQISEPQLPGRPYPK